MRFFIMIVGMFILLLVKDVFAETDLSKLAGKQIYRDVPAKNEKEFSMEFIGKPFQLIYYSSCLMELQGSEGRRFVIKRDLWDDGNWKLWELDLLNSYWRPYDYDRVSYKKLKEKNVDSVKVSNDKKKSLFYEGQEVWDIAKGRGRVVNLQVIDGNTRKVKVKFERDLINGIFDMDDYTLDGKYKDSQVQRLFPIEIKSVVYNLDKLFPIEEIKRLDVRQVMPQTFFSLGYSVQAQYSCVRCGKKSCLNFCGYNYYCNKCNIEFDIKER